MKKIKFLKIFSDKWVRYGLLLLLGLFLGWLLFHPSGRSKYNHDHQTEASQGTIWTCAMHPQIRMPQPGKCPICGMDLIPLVQSSTSSVDPAAIHFTKEAAELANVLTTKVTRQKPVKEVRLYGKVQADERLFQSQVAQVPGRIERLFVNFTGEQVSKGQKLAEIYSPELITAQQELFETAKTKQLQPVLYDATKEKLRQWKLSDVQIVAIETSGNIINNFDVLSNTSGTVTARRVSTGDYVSQGSLLFEIADLSRVWILFDAYESDLPFLYQGEKVTFSIHALPGVDFTGNIAFIDPVIDPVTRVAKVRVETTNPSGRLKPEMFATGIVSSVLNQYRNNIVIPKSAVLWTGKRSIVYVRQPESDEPVFNLREIGIGPMLGDSFVVTDGLSEGEEIVTSGTFSVDAAAQLEGKPSMMNPGGGVKTSSMPGMIMPGDSRTEDDQSMQGMDMSGEKKDVGQASGGRNSNVSEVTYEKTSDPDKIVSKSTPAEEIINAYLLLKNNFTHDEASMAAKSANHLKTAFTDFNVESLQENQRKIFTDIKEDVVENAEHIAENAGNIEHQREHFEILSGDIYDLVKAFGTGQTLFKVFCPMYNNGKGAFWLSETKEIKNPYFGKSMLTCGTIQEEL